MAETIELEGKKSYDFSFLFLDQSTADVHFVCGPKDCESPDIIPAHRFVLSSLSAVFKTMFFGNLVDKPILRVADATGNGFKEFLQYFYKHTVTITIEYAAEVIYLSQKYELNEFKNVYSAFLERELTIDRMCMGLELAIEFDMMELMESCLCEIYERCDEFFASEGFIRCNTSVLRTILESELIKSQSEAIFSGCFQWARNTWKSQHGTMNEPKMSDIRNKLNNHFHLIDFERMSYQAISKILCEFNDFFTKKDLATIHSILAAKCSTAMKQNVPQQ